METARRLVRATTLEEQLQAAGQCARDVAVHLRDDNQPSDVQDIGRVLIQAVECYLNTHEPHVGEHLIQAVRENAFKY